jgi:hypothetical protein
MKYEWVDVIVAWRFLCTTLSNECDIAEVAGFARKTMRKAGETMFGQSFEAQGSHLRGSTVRR